MENPNEEKGRVKRRGQEVVEVEEERGVINNK